MRVGVGKDVGVGKEVTVAVASSGVEGCVPPHPARSREIDIRMVSVRGMRVSSRRFSGFLYYHVLEIKRASQKEMPDEISCTLTVIDIF